MCDPEPPVNYDPVTHPDNTITRRNLILKNMRDDGKISQEEYYEATKEEIALNRPKRVTRRKLTVRLTLTRMTAQLVH